METSRGAFVKKNESNGHGLIQKRGRALPQSSWGSWEEGKGGKGEKKAKGSESAFFRELKDWKEAER